MKMTVTESVPKVPRARRDTVCRVRFVAGQKAPRYCVHGSTATLEMDVPHEPLSRHQWMVLMRRTIRTAQSHGIARLIIVWQDIVRDDMDAATCAQMIAENMHMAAYTFRTYKKKPADGWQDVAEVVMIAPHKERRVIARGVRTGTVIAAQVNACRDLANTPGDDMTPALLVRRVRALARGVKNVRVRVLTPQQMRARKMGGVLAVGRGSAHTPRFLIVEYMGGAKTAKPIVLVGKGVTFDSGGIDVKPYPYATEMMMDMSGGAAVVTALLAAAKLGLKKNIVALVPAVENMPGGSSFRPGDVLRMMDGTTVEVRNTDAEGRLILADALTYAQKYYTPAQIVDVATLTGAALVALGQQASAVCTRDDMMASELFTCGEESGDRAWPLPLWDEYDVMLKSDVADIANISTPGQDRYAGTITAAAFLKHFVDESIPWAHIDMAPRMTATKDEALAPGAAGAPVRLLMRLLMRKGSSAKE